MSRLDPVAAYDRLAGEFAKISASRRHYLTAVEEQIVANAPTGARSMLDIGAANGQRSLRLAKQLGIDELTLLEPSAAMRAAWPAHVTAWDIRAEELSAKQASFDVVTCLWNVLGHVFPCQARLHVVKQIARLLTPNGRAFIDVSHRYNLRHYGTLRTLQRMLGDFVRRDRSGGDVRVSWAAGGCEVVSTGHVFVAREMEELFAQAGLKVERRLAIDYATGERQRSLYAGHLYYQLKADLRSSSSPSGTDASASTIRRAPSPSP